MPDHPPSGPPRPASIVDQSTVTRSTVNRRTVLKGLSGILAAATAPALLTSCSAADASENTLKFWQFYAPSPIQEPTAQAQSKWFVDMVDAWNAENDVKVELVFIPGVAYLGGAKLQTAFAAGTGPDIFIISPGDFLRYYNGGVLADLTPHMSKEAIDDFYPDAIANRSVGDKVYGLPMEIEPLAMFYGVDAWEKAGLSEADIPTTWDQLLAVGEKLQSPTRAGLVFDTPTGYYQNFTWYPWMWQGGGKLLNDDGSVAFNSDATVAALKLWQDGVNAGISPRTLPAAGDLIGAFKADQAGMWQSGIWNVAVFRDIAPDFKYGAFKLPVPDGGEYTTDLGGWAFVANKQSRNAEAAAKFCVWALGSMEKDSVERVANWCTVAKTDISPRTSALELATSRGGYDSPMMRKFKDEIFPGGRNEPRYPPVIYKAISDAIQACMLAGKDPREQADLAARAIEAYLKSYEGAEIR